MKIDRDRRFRWRPAVIALVAVSIAMTVACWPVQRQVAVNFAVETQTLPLWVKTMEFIDRDRGLAELSGRVLDRISGDEARAMAALAWTRANIRPQPPQLPVVDDHIWHIVIRGYGLPDQQADVFTALLAYAGTPAFWTLIGNPPDEMPLSYARVEGRWAAFDVAEGVVFRNRDGSLATPDELAASAGLVRAASTRVSIDPDRYATYFSGYRAPEIPDVLRIDLQRPLPRLRYELRRLVGNQPNAWQMRPRAAQQDQKGPR